MTRNSWTQWTCTPSNPLDLKGTFLVTKARAIPAIADIFRQQDSFQCSKHNNCDCNCNSCQKKITRKPGLGTTINPFLPCKRNQFCKCESSWYRSCAKKTDLGHEYKPNCKQDTFKTWIRQFPSSIILHWCWIAGSADSWPGCSFPLC